MGVKGRKAIRKVRASMRGTRGSGESGRPRFRKDKTPTALLPACATGRRASMRTSSPPLPIGGVRSRAEGTPRAWPLTCGTELPSPLRTTRRDRVPEGLCSTRTLRTCGGEWTGAAEQPIRCTEVRDDNGCRADFPGPRSAHAPEFPRFPPTAGGVPGAKPDPASSEDPRRSGAQASGPRRVWETAREGHPVRGPAVPSGRAERTAGRMSR